MKGSSYRERDYAFGQVMLTLRTRLELTQTELADMLGVRRRAVIDWEGGLTYPKADHLKQFVVLATRRQAWPFGREAEEARALWQGPARRCSSMKPGLVSCCPTYRLPRHPGPERRPVLLPHHPTRSLLLPGAGHASIGATRLMWRTSMGASGNWTCSLRGWCRSAVGW